MKLDFAFRGAVRTLALIFMIFLGEFAMFLRGEFNNYLADIFLEKRGSKSLMSFNTVLWFLQVAADVNLRSFLFESALSLDTYLLRVDLNLISLTSNILMGIFLEEWAESFISNARCIIY